MVDINTGVDDGDYYASTSRVERRLRLGGTDQLISWLYEVAMPNRGPVIRDRSCIRQIRGCARAIRLRRVHRLVQFDRQDAGLQVQFQDRSYRVQNRRQRDHKELAVRVAQTSYYPAAHQQAGQVDAGQAKRVAYNQPCLGLRRGRTCRDEQ